MGKIINAAEMTPEKKFLIWTIPTMRPEGDTLLDNLKKLPDTQT